MSSANAPRESATRESGIDALKVAVTALVVFHHTAITYGAIGGWYYKEMQTSGSPSSLLLVFFCTINQAWFMGLFFLLAGRYLPAGVARHGKAAYLRERLLRLGVPWLVFGYVVGPITLAIARTTRGDGFVDMLLRLWGAAAFVNGPTWFASALLVFSVAAVLLMPREPAAPAARKFPSNRALLLAALGCAATAFAVRLAFPVGTDIGGWQLGYFPSYVALFAFGVWRARQGDFEAPPPAQTRLWRRVAWFTLPMLLPLAFLAKRFPVFAGPATGGWNLPSLMYALWEPFLAWGVLMALLAWAARTRAGEGALAQQMARRAYAVFVLHPPVVVAVCVTWREVQAPALLKFAISGSLACMLTFLLAGAVLRLPGVRRVL